MAGEGFRPKLEPAIRPGSFAAANQISFILLDSLKARTRLLLGALIQVALCAALPLKWAIVPAGGMLVHSVILTTIQVISGNSPFIEGTVPGRATAQVPSEKGTYGPTPGDDQLVVFNLGVQFNHPLGALSPHAAKIGEYFIALQKELSRRRDDYGLLDLSYWRGGERDANSSLIIKMLFRNVEDIHRFAHDDLHREVWNYWKKAGEPRHIGIFHETYCVPAKAYETVYVNCKPVLFGRGRVRTAAFGEDGQKQWHSTLVSADTPLLKTQYARLNRHESGVPKE